VKDFITKHGNLYHIIQIQHLRPGNVVWLDMYCSSGYTLTKPTNDILGCSVSFLLFDHLTAKTISYSFLNELVPIVVATRNYS
jgi:hypothetical protein